MNKVQFMCHLSRILSGKFVIPDKPQLIDSWNELVGAEVARINCKCTGSTKELSLAIFRSLSIVIR